MIIVKRTIYIVCSVPYTVRRTPYYCNLLYAVHRTTDLYCTPYTVLLQSTVCRTLYAVHHTTDLYCTAFSVRRNTVLLIFTVRRTLYAVHHTTAIYCTPYNRRILYAVQYTSYNVHRTIWIMYVWLRMDIHVHKYK